MQRLDRYILRQLVFALIFATGAVSFVVIFSQLFRLLSLVINNAGTLGVFFELIALTVPAFMPLVLPLAFGVATLFIYYKLASDSELVVMRAAGISPLRQAAPALGLAAVMLLVCAALTLWIAPMANQSLVGLQTKVKNSYAVFLSRPGYFNDITDGLTFYAQRRDSKGSLQGILIHDVRKRDTPVTTMAATGKVTSANGRPQIIIFDGKRQEFDATTGKLNELAFDQYVLDLTALRSAAPKRMPDPREQTVVELLNPSPEMLRVRASREHLLAELHQRIATPLLVFSYGLIALAAILAGDFNRRGLTQRVVAAALAIIITQATFMSVTGMVSHNLAMAFLLYAVASAPVPVCLILLTSRHNGAIVGTPPKEVRA